MSGRITKAKKAKPKRQHAPPVKVINPFKFSEKELDELLGVDTDKQAVPRFYPGHEAFVRAHNQVLRTHNRSFKNDFLRKITERSNKPKKVWDPQFHPHYHDLDELIPYLMSKYGDDAGFIFDFRGWKRGPEGNIIRCTTMDTDMWGMGSPDVPSSTAIGDGSTGMLFPRVSIAHRPKAIHSAPSPAAAESQHHEAARPALRGILKRSRQDDLSEDHTAPTAQPEAPVRKRARRDELPRWLTSHPPSKFGTRLESFQNTEKNIVLQDNTTNTPDRGTATQSAPVRTPKTRDTEICRTPVKASVASRAPPVTRKPSTVRPDATGLSTLRRPLECSPGGTLSSRFLLAIEALNPANVAATSEPRLPQSVSSKSPSRESVNPETPHRKRSSFSAAALLSDVPARPNKPHTVGPTGHSDGYNLGSVRFNLMNASKSAQAAGKSFIAPTCTAPPRRPAFMEAVVTPEPKASASATGKQEKRTIFVDAIVVPKRQENISEALKNVKRASRIPIPIGKGPEYKALQNVARKTSSVSAPHLRRWMRVVVIPRYLKRREQSSKSSVGDLPRSRIPVPIGKTKQFELLSGGGGTFVAKQYSTAPSKGFLKVPVSNTSPADVSSMFNPRKRRATVKWVPPQDKRVKFTTDSPNPFNIIGLSTSIHPQGTSRPSETEEGTPSKGMHVMDDTFNSDTDIRLDNKENAAWSSGPSGQRKRKLGNGPDPADARQNVKRVHFSNDSPEMISPLHTSSGNTPLPGIDTRGSTKRKTRDFEVFRDPVPGESDVTLNGDEKRTTEQAQTALEASEEPYSPPRAGLPKKRKRAFEVYRDPDCQ